MSVESLKSIFDIATVVLLGLTFLAGFGVLITGNIVNKEQATKLRQFDNDLTGAKTELAKQQQRAADAEGKIKLAEQHSAEANAKAEGFRLDIAKANERAASANETAEKERLARLQLEGKIADRILTPLQQQVLSTSLRPFGSFRVQVRWYVDSPEITRLANAITNSLGNAGWFAVGSASLASSVTTYDVVVAISREKPKEVRAAAMALVTGLRKNGISAELTDVPMQALPLPTMTLGGIDMPNAQMLILVGPKHQ